jgi:hypothetical protein
MQSNNQVIYYKNFYCKFNWKYTSFLENNFRDGDPHTLPEGTHGRIHPTADGDMLRRICIANASAASPRGR